MSVLPSAAQDPRFGVIEITAKTHVFKLSRTIHFRDIEVTKATFSPAPNQAVMVEVEVLLAAVAGIVVGWPRWFGGGRSWGGRWFRRIRGGGFVVFTADDNVVA